MGRSAPVPQRLGCLGDSRGCGAKATGIAHCRAGYQGALRARGLYAPGGPLRDHDEAARLIILLSMSDYFMIILGAPPIIFTASLQRL